MFSDGEWGNETWNTVELPPLIILYWAEGICEFDAIPELEYYIERQVSVNGVETVGVEFWINNIPSSSELYSRLQYYTEQMVSVNRKTETGSLYYTQAMVSANGSGAAEKRVYDRIRDPIYVYYTISQSLVYYNWRLVVVKRRAWDVIGLVDFTKSHHSSVLYWAEGICDRWWKYSD